MKVTDQLTSDWKTYAWLNAFGVYHIEILFDFELEDKYMKPSNSDCAVNADGKIATVDTSQQASGVLPNSASWNLAIDTWAANAMQFTSAVTLAKHRDYKLVRPQMLYLH